MYAVNKTLPQFFYDISIENKLEPLFFHRKNIDVEFSIVYYKDFLKLWHDVTLGLKKAGVKRGDRIFILSDNRYEWLLLDMAIMSLGAITSPRGNDISDEDLTTITSHLEPHFYIAETSFELEKIKSLGVADNAVFTIEDYPETNNNVLSIKDLLKMGEKENEANPLLFLEELKRGKNTDTATIIYTSGTSSNPKGVVLTHYAFLCQIDMIRNRIDVNKKHRGLSILPVWHVYERILEYILLCIGGSIVYSKPIAKRMVLDIKKTFPDIITAVPRLYESIYKNVLQTVNKSSYLKRAFFFTCYFIANSYHNLADFKERRFFQPFRIPLLIRNILDLLIALFALILYPLERLANLLIFRKIKNQFGKNLRFMVSGGAHLPLKIDKFFRNVGINLIEGYGMTEMAPLTHLRSDKKNVKGSVGPLLNGIQYYLIDEHGKKNYKKGELHVKAPNVMTCYYKNPQATNEVLSNGFYNTGDIAQVGINGMFKIIGRTKNLVVLANGENIETEPLETILNTSIYISHSVIVGQDEKYLGALIVPEFDNLKHWAMEKNLAEHDNIKDLLKTEEVQALYNKIIKAEVNSKKCFKNSNILKFALLDKPFDINLELTTTLKVKRHYVDKNYSKEIEKLFID